MGGITKQGAALSIALAGGIGLLGANVILNAKASSGYTPPIVNLELYFLDVPTESDFATNHLTVISEAPDVAATFTPKFNSLGFELGAAHYIWFYMWPYNNPGEITVDIGAIVDLWGPFNGQGNGGLPLWRMEIANFDYNPKQITFSDNHAQKSFFLADRVQFYNITQLSS